MTGTPNLAVLAQLSEATKALAAKVAPSVVAISSQRSRSSGFLWRPGLVVTAEEALPDEGEIAVTLAGNRHVAATIVGRDPATAVALLRIEAADGAAVSLKPVATALGALALVVGAEQGEPTAALGIVARASGAWRSMRGGEIDTRVELDANLRRSAEGGLVVDAAGDALGMAVFGPRRRVLVIPSATIETVAQALERHGRIPRGYLGLGLQPVTMDDAGEAGVMVLSVDSRGPGAAAGMLQGDIIVAWDGEPVGHPRALLRSLGPSSVGKVIALGVRRAGERREMKLTVGERPND
ncbi:MAG: S1C family serine protease [Vitreimonas sp.]